MFKWHPSNTNSCLYFFCLICVWFFKTFHISKIIILYIKFSPHVQITWTWIKKKQLSNWKNNKISGVHEWERQFLFSYFILQPTEFNGPLSICLQNNPSFKTFHKEFWKKQLNFRLYFPLPIFHFSIAFNSVPKPYKEANMWTETT